MCNVCCPQFKGWCKAFTRTERLLTILEVILLVLLICFLTFLILHLIACSKEETPDSYKVDTTESQEITDQAFSTQRSTLGRDVKCTWKPSKKTRATTRYYEYGQPPVPSTKMNSLKVTRPLKENETSIITSSNVQATPVEDYSEEMAGVEESDGEEPEKGFDKFVIALVKIKPLRDIMFGCILTIVSEYWTLTAASCIEAVEEVDSLDSFVMLEGYGEAAAGERGRAHAVDEVRVHPLYGGVNSSYDVAALRSGDRLAPPVPPLRLPTVLDYSLLTLGERLIILGYGGFRTTDNSESGRSLREVHVYRLPTGACAAPGAWSPRHLSRPAPAPGGSCVGPDVCAGPLHARGLPCNYCSGTPLLAGRLLLGVMADNQQCGVACEPATYVNLAVLKDWLDAVFSPDKLS